MELRLHLLASHDRHLCFAFRDISSSASLSASMAVVIPRVGGHGEWKSCSAVQRNNFGPTFSPHAETGSSSTMRYYSLHDPNLVRGCW